ncbi:hypothetical protein HID58_060818 [Brassica napus]|uniref:BnaC04g24590D protein n=3 Tax=Brassica TaxID=3705 RepID=A0A078GWV4_BRANA|nr:hypothetical protein HID58_060818 [Brassica napus]CAF1849903.1 unnamed protein product [Brassica napus]CDY30965.1 BnaC04g24590D [Brassica napus]VDD09645.1 unnamed protein product [Brassica oleracea]
MIQATSKATTTRHDKSSLNHEAKLTMLKARSRWSHDLCKHGDPTTPPYRPSPDGSKATPGEAPVKLTTFADHITRTEDFRQCEDFVTELATRDENCDDRYDHCCEHNGKHRHCGG